MTDSFKGPRPLPARKARVNRGARERIIRTDEALERQIDATERERQYRGYAERENEALQRVFTGPADEAFIDSVYRQAGAMLADLLMEKLQAEYADELADFGKAALHELVATSTAPAAQKLADRIGVERKVKAKAYRNPMERTTTVVTSVVIQRLDVHHAFDFDDPW